MKWVRWLIGAIVLLLCGIGVLFIPSVQKAIFVSVVSTDERRVSVDTFRLGLSGLKIEGLEFSSPEILARVPSVEASFSWSELFRKRLRVNEIVVRDFTLQFAGEAETVERKDTEITLPQGFRGILGNRVPLELGSASISGTIVTAEGGSAEVNAMGGNLLAGQTSEFSVTLSPDADAASAIPEVTATLTTFLTAEADVGSLNLRVVAESRLPEVEGEIELLATAESSSSGEDYTVELLSEDLLKDGTLGLTGKWIESTGLLELAFEAEIVDLDVVRAFYEGELPEVSCFLSGQTTIRPGEGMSTGHLSFSLESGEDLIPNLNQAVTSSGRLSIERVEKGLLVDEFEIEVSPKDSEKEWLALRLLRPQIFAVGEVLSVEDGDFAEIVFSLPSEFLQGFLVDLEVGDLTGTMVGSVEGDSYLLRATRDWEIELADADWDGDRLKVLGQPSFSLSNESLKAEGLVSVQSGGSSLNFDLDVEGSRELNDGVRVGLVVDGDLRAAWPIWPTGRDLIGGLVTGKWDLIIDDRISGEGALGMTEIEGEGILIDEVQVQLEDFSIATETPMNFYANADLEWLANGGRSRIEVTELEGSQNETERWRFRLPKVLAQLDQRSLQILQKQSVQQPSSMPERPFDPSVFQAMFEPPAIPVDLDLLGAEIEWTDGKSQLKADASVKSLVAGESGEIVLAGRVQDLASGRSANAQVEGKVEIDAAAALRSATATASIEPDSAVQGFEAVFLDLAYRPSSDLEPLSLRWLSERDGFPLLSISGAPTEEGAVFSAEADFATWTRSPLRNSFPNLSTGHLSAEVNLSEDLSFTADIEALTPLDAFDSFDVEASGSLLSAPPVEARSALKVTDAKGRTSDLNLEVLGDPAERIEAILTGQRVDIESLQDFARVWSKPTETEVSTSPKSEPGDQWPLENLPFPVEAKLGIAELIVPNLPSVNALDGLISLARDSGSVRMAGDWQDESEFSFEASVERKDEEVSGVVVGKIEGLEATSLLTNLQPGQTPSVEGTFDTAVNFSGNASNLEDLPSFLTGTIEISGRNGLIRSLKPETRVSRIVQAGSLAGIVFADTLNRPGLAALGEVANLFTEIPFSQLVILIGRTAAQETTVDSVRLRGPYLSIDGSGRVAPGRLEDVATNPMNLSLVMGSKPPLARPLQILGFLGDNKNVDGYVEWARPVVLKGSFSEVDTSELWGSLITAVKRAATLQPKDIEGIDGEQESERENGRSTTEEIFEQGANRLREFLNL
ncbi:MAG: hypothetical protein AAGJ81_11015 [Verrucomicrobiota bacterium]